MGPDFARADFFCFFDRGGIDPGQSYFGVYYYYLEKGQYCLLPCAICLEPLIFYL